MSIRCLTLLAAAASCSLAFADSVTQWGGWNTPPTGAPAGIPGVDATRRPSVPLSIQNHEQAELARAGHGGSALIQTRPIDGGFVNNGNWVGYTASRNFGETGATFVTVTTYQQGFSFSFPQSNLNGTSPPPQNPEIASLIASLLAEGYKQRSDGAYALTYSESLTRTERGPNGGSAGTIRHEILPSGQLLPGFWTPTYLGEVVQNITLDGASATVRKSVALDFPALSNSFWWSSAGFSLDGQTGVFVAGQPTPLSEISALRAGNVSATYTGSAIQYGHAVNLSVNFGAATWAGTWAGGTTQALNSTLKGGDNFSASGNVTGATLVGTATGAGILSGSINASFAGPSAATVLGKTDLSIDRLGGGAVRLTDVFSASRPQSSQSAVGASTNGYNVTAGVGQTQVNSWSWNCCDRILNVQRSMVINGQTFPIPPGK